MIQAARPTNGISRWIKEPYCGLSHGSGAVAWLIGVAVLLWRTHGDSMTRMGLVAYGISAVMLFTASALAHSLDVGRRAEDWLNRLDHAAIFCLIAGTYAPICLTVLRGPLGYTILSIEAAMAVTGVALVLLTRVPLNWIAPLYLPMGWLIAVVASPLLRLASPGVVTWLLAGGVIFSLGAAVFITERPRLWPGRFGYHDLWHTMVLAGAACHFIAIALLVLRA